MQQQAFRALADPTRRDILVMLRKGERNIAEVAGQFSMTRGAIQKHLNILDEGGLISTRTEGRSRINALRPEGMRNVIDWFSFFDTFWDEKLTNLKNEIEKEKP